MVEKIVLASENELRRVFERGLDPLLSDAVARDYVVGILVRYAFQEPVIHTENAQSVGEERKSNPEAPHLGRKAEFSPETAYTLQCYLAVRSRDVVGGAFKLKTIADAILYQSGFFPERLTSQKLLFYNTGEEKGRLQVWYDLGSAAYAQTASHARTKKALRRALNPDLFDHLAEDFSRLAEALQLLKENLKYKNSLPESLIQQLESGQAVLFKGSSMIN